jgi:hypothetical protein
MDPVEAAKEIVKTWCIIVDEERELTQDETDYIMKLQEKVIEQMRLEDGLTEEELEAENNANHFLDYFKDRDHMRIETDEA